MGRERRQTIKIREYLAKKAGASERFTSRQKAHAWAGRGTVEPYRMVCEDYELRIDKPASEPWPDPKAKLAPTRLYECLFVINGTVSAEDPWTDLERRLRREASARREASYDRHILYLTDENTRRQNPKDFPASALRYAMERREAWFQRGTERFVEFHERRTEDARVSSLPTIAEAHQTAVEDDRQAGRISVGTADSARHLGGPWLTILGKTRIDKVTSETFGDWLSEELAKSEGGTKRLKNAVGEIRRLHKHLMRTRSPYAHLFSVEALQNDLSRIVRDADGSKSKDVLTADEVERIIASCLSDWERGAIGLALIGIRCPGEVAGASWADFSSDLGSSWIQVNHTVVDRPGGELYLDQPKDVKVRKRSGKDFHRHFPISERVMRLIEPLREVGDFVLGNGPQLVDPGLVAESIDAIFVRSGVKREGITPYSFRHTIMDQTEHLAGPQYRDLLHRGDADHSVANKIYTHADASRFRARLLLPDGRTCADVLPWGK